jgi:hypothetical protein
LEQYYDVRRFGGKVTFETRCELLKGRSDASLLLWKVLDRPRTNLLNTKCQQNKINLIRGCTKKQTYWNKEKSANIVMGFPKNNIGLQSHVTVK